MRTVSYTAVRGNLAKTMQKIAEDHTPMIVTRASAEPIVMISLEDFESMQETYYLMKSSSNAARLADAIDEIEMLIAKDKDKKK